MGLEKDTSKNLVDAKFNVTASKIDLVADDSPPSGTGHESAKSEGVGAALQKGTIFGAGGSK